MLENGLPEQDSFIHHLDPRSKIIAVTLFSVMVALSNQWTSLTFSLVLGICVLCIIHQPLKDIQHRLIPVNTFLLFLWFFLPFSVDGKPLFSIGPLMATHEGMDYAIRISIKSNAIMCMLIALSSSTSISDLGHALSKLNMPEKMVQLLFFTYRYIHVLHREYIRLMNAMKVRVFQPKTNLHTYKTYAYLLGMLLVRSSSRAQRVYNAMICRGFMGDLYSLYEFSIKRNDVLFLLLMGMFLFVLAILEWAVSL